MADQIEKLSWMVQAAFEYPYDDTYTVMYTVEDCEEAWLARGR